MECCRSGEVEVEKSCSPRGQVADLEGSRDTNRVVFKSITLYSGKQHNCWLVIRISVEWHGIAWFCSYFNYYSYLPPKWCTPVNL